MCTAIGSNEPHSSGWDVRFIHHLMIDRTPPGQRTETTSPYLAIVGAIVIIGFGIFAFSFWPHSDTLSTDPTGNIPKN